MSSTNPIRRALLVDADEDTRDLYQAFLVPRRYCIEQAANGRQALAQATLHPPDIVVTETRLEGIDGYRLCEQLRADRDTRTVAIVVLTADARPISLERARRAGADVVLTKPCLPEVLLEEMDRASRKRERAVAGWPLADPDRPQPTNGRKWDFR